MEGSDREPLLQKVNAQHLQQGKWRPDFELFWVPGVNELDQRSPWHHLHHLLMENLLAGFYKDQVEVQGGFFLAAHFLDFPYQQHMR